MNAVYRKASHSVHNIRLHLYRISKYRYKVLKGIVAQSGIPEEEWTGRKRGKVEI